MKKTLVEWQKLPCFQTVRKDNRYEDQEFTSVFRDEEGRFWLVEYHDGHVYEANEERKKLGRKYKPPMQELAGEEVQIERREVWVSKETTESRFLMSTLTVGERRVLSKRDGGSRT